MKENFTHQIAKSNLEQLKKLQGSLLTLVQLKKGVQNITPNDKNISISGETPCNLVFQKDTTQFILSIESKVVFPDQPYDELSQLNFSITSKSIYENDNQEFGFVGLGGHDYLLSYVEIFSERRIETFKICPSEEELDKIANEATTDDYMEILKKMEAAKIKKTRKIKLDNILLFSLKNGLKLILSNNSEFQNSISVSIYKEDIKLDLLSQTYTPQSYWDQNIGASMEEAPKLQLYHLEHSIDLI